MDIDFELQKCSPLLAPQLRSMNERQGLIWVVKLFCTFLGDF